MSRGGGGLVCVKVSQCVSRAGWHMDCVCNPHYVGVVVSGGAGEVDMKYWLIGITAALSLMAMAPDPGGSVQLRAVSVGTR